VSALFDMARIQLAGVGNPALGEWREVGDRAVHLRRRLMLSEMHDGGIAAVCDIRGTPEQTTRVERMRPFLPLEVRYLDVAAFP
jgi:hypothetical protein